MIGVDRELALDFSSLLKNTNAVVIKINGIKFDFNILLINCYYLKPL